MDMFDRVFAGIVIFCFMAFLLLVSGIMRENTKTLGKIETKMESCCEDSVRYEDCCGKYRRRERCKK